MHKIWNWMSINTYDVIWEGLIYYLYKITLTSDDDNKKMMSKKSVLYVKDDLFQKLIQKQWF